VSESAIVSWPERFPTAAAAWRRLHRGAGSRKWPRYTSPRQTDASVLPCCVAYNEHGAYCVPLSSRHSPCAQAILDGRVWEAKTLALMAAAGGDVIHAGTYFGDFLPALSRSRAAGAKVWAFEPNLENYRCALLTVHLNALANVELFNAGVGNRRTVMQMRLKDDNDRSLGGMSHIVRPGVELLSSRMGAVDVRRIDDVVPGDRCVSIVQLDVEGFETQALAGARETIRRCSPMLILESVPHERWLAQHLAPLGYRAERAVAGNTVFVCEKGCVA
jgi:FkbM family methyltransferase